jgi:hypothetical protein
MTAELAMLATKERKRRFDWIFLWSATAAGKRQTKQKVSDLRFL